MGLGERVVNSSLCRFEKRVHWGEDVETTGGLDRTGEGREYGGRGLKEAAIVTVVVVERRRAKGEGKGGLMPDGAQARAAGRWGANARGWRHGNGRQRKATRRRRRAATGDESGAAARAVGVPLPLRLSGWLVDVKVHGRSHQAKAKAEHCRSSSVAVVGVGVRRRRRVGSVHPWSALSAVSGWRSERGKIVRVGR